MSADNRLCIQQVGKSEWAVWGGSCSDSYFEPPAYASHFYTEEEADAYLREEADRIGYLEGGVTVIGKDEQESALVEEIRYLEGRLKRLRETGKPWIEFDNP